MIAQKTVHVIPANPEIRLVDGRPKKLRVAAYCRVSTDEEEQLNSYQNQIVYFKEKILSNPEWSLVGIFADEGITGTSAKKRPEFMRLLKQCKQGKVDLILAKSVSRFCRNNADFITIIRELKDLDVGIFFEKENINTQHATNELIITLLGALAQGESESISGNVKHGMHMSFKNGSVKVSFAGMLGYKNIKKSLPEIIESEAAVIRKIYEWYLSGYSLERIKQEISTTPEYASIRKKSWSPQAISNILTNEKYCGNVLCQKSFVKDCISKKIIKNTGQMPQYLIRNYHEGIVSEEIWKQVAEEMLRRKSKRKVSDKHAITENGKYSGKYALTEMLYCADCGTAYRRTTWTQRNKQKQIVWRCVKRLETGSKYCAHSPTVLETQLHNAIIQAINGLEDDRLFLGSLLRDTILTAFNSTPRQLNIVAMKKEIEQLQAKMMAIVEDSISRCADIEESSIDTQIKAIADKVKELQTTIALQEQSSASDGMGNAQMQELLALIETAELGIAEYDDLLARKLISSIRVDAKDKITIFWRHGYEQKVLLA